MKIKKIIAALVLTGVVFLGLLGTSQKTYAAKYKAKLYTTPKVIRGTWYYKSGKSIGSAGPSKIMHPYSKVKITKHTITFYLKAHKKGLKGKYTFYEGNNFKYTTIKNYRTAQTYATKHRWLMPYDYKNYGFTFSNSWPSIGESSATGFMWVRGKKLLFGNGYFEDIFKK